MFVVCFDFTNGIQYNGMHYNDFQKPCNIFASKIKSNVRQRSDIKSNVRQTSDIACNVRRTADITCRHQDKKKDKDKDK